MSKAVLFYDYSSRTRQSLLPPAYTTPALLYPSLAATPRLAAHPPPTMLAFLALLSLPALPLVAAQGDLSAANNVTDLEGTWSSNSAVSTGGVSPSPPSWAFLITVAGYMCTRRDEIQLSQQQRYLLFIVRSHLSIPCPARSPNAAPMTATLKKSSTNTTPTPPTPPVSKPSSTGSTAPTPLTTMAP